ncbi:6-bladed beta-propeller [Algoriphagus sp.]|uniref:6-bladed beta-propeller n=1 Tax=Algoriphagus sp. TaxID=1872435 RepID=UPI002621D7EC|nr:6-bladed beta-propeller [Algoriphagus sp.]
MRKKFWFYIFLVTIISCTEPTELKTSDQTIEIQVENAKDAKLSVLYESIEYVLLKNSDEFPLVRPYKFKFSGDLMGIEDTGAEQYVFFDLKGNPRFKLVASGGGPGEFQRTEDFQFSNNEIIVKDPMLSKFLFYDRQGNYLQEEKSRVRTSYFFKNDKLELHYSKNIREHGDFDFYRIENNQIIPIVPSKTFIKDVVFSDINSFMIDTNSESILFKIPYSTRIVFFDSKGEIKDLVEFDFGDKYLSIEEQSKLTPEEKDAKIMKENLVSLGIGSFFPLEGGYLATFGTGYKYSHQVFLDQNFNVKGHYYKIRNDIDRMPIKTVPWFSDDNRIGFYMPSAKFLANYLEKFEIGMSSEPNSNLHQFVEENQYELGEDSYVLTFLKVKKEVFND